MRRTKLLLIIAAFGIGIGLFRIKYQVMALERQYKDITHSVKDCRESIHILKAELTHLNDPKRLQKLAETHLGFVAIKPVQMISVQELPKQKTTVKLADDPIEALMEAVNAVTAKSTPTNQPHTLEEAKKDASA